VTEVCIVDELAGAADLVMGKASGVPVAICRGVDPEWLGEGGAETAIPRHPSEDLFR
jgi:coenzyme F420-0:L-glutamate ligase/coenzyme F420-1:gamma-L-glutamate ligase